MLEQQYLQLLRKLYNKATSDKPVLNDNRTGVKTIALANQTLTHDLSNSELPLLYSKKVLVNAIIHELIWMLSGSTNIKYLKDNKVNIWNNWSRPDGELGKVYGYQMRNWNTLKLLDKDKAYWTSMNPDYESTDLIDSSTFKDKVLVRHTVDQIKKIEWQLKNNPNDRRIVLNLWNVTDLDEMSLSPCHFATVFTVIDGKLNSHLTMRSADLFLGVPFNVVFYSILTIMLAKLNGLELGEFAVTMVNCHIYENHLDAIKTQLDRISNLDLNVEQHDYYYSTFNYLDTIELPTLEFKIKNSVLDYKFEDLKVNNYKHMSFIKAPVAV